MRKNYVAALVAAPLALAGSLAHAVDPTSGVEAISGLTTGQAGYMGPMLLLAVAGVGIGIAVKWVKRAKGAA